MCVALFTLEHAEYALSVRFAARSFPRELILTSILGTNRDEYLSRRTQPAAFHDRLHSPVLSGIDVQAGGTWLGLTRSGRLALLTNITEPDHTFDTSRGALVSAFLASSSRACQEDVEKDVPEDARYAGFNLVLLAPADPAPHLALDALYVTNHGAGGPIAYRALSDTQRQSCVLSNGIDGRDADEWPKVQHGLDAFRHVLDTLPPNTPDDQLAEQLFELLTWRSARPPRDRSELKNTIQVDPIELSKGLYATRVSTVVLVKRSGQVLFIERDRWMLSGDEPVLANPSSQRLFRFTLEHA